ncbi:MAG: response regulator [Nitrospirae bacterium]|nr:response regulator [Nitrospirota bacterium]
MAMSNNKKILVAEDEELIGWSLRKFFESDGYRVDMVHSGIDALNRIRNNEYDIVVTDLFMPGMSGMEVLSKMKQDGITTPVIVTSAYFSEKIMSDVLDGGAFRCINKPFKLEDVLVAIKDAERVSIR